MAINYNTNWLKGSYENDALHFIGWFENSALMTRSGAKLAAHWIWTFWTTPWGNRDRRW
jgi:hypothetical protein